MKLFGSLEEMTEAGGAAPLTKAQEAYLERLAKRIEDLTYELQEFFSVEGREAVGLVIPVRGEFPRPIFDKETAAILDRVNARIKPRY